MTTMVEPEWDEQTRSVALGLSEYYSKLCPCGCGYPAAVSQDPANQFAFTVPAPTRCHARTAMLAEQARVTEETNPQHQALLWSTVLRDDEEVVTRDG